MKIQLQKRAAATTKQCSKEALGLSESEGFKSLPHPPFFLNCPFDRMTPAAANMDKFLDLLLLLLPLLLPEDTTATMVA